MVRAFDKAVRRKPVAFAADASLWELNVGKDRDAAQLGSWEGGVRRREPDWTVFRCCRNPGEGGTGSGTRRKSA